MSDKKKFQSSINSKLITISIMNNKSDLDHAHKDIELIYMIKGNLQVKVNNNTLQMKSSDFLLINSNEIHSFQSEKDNLFVVFHINYFELSSLLGEKKLLFSCCSIEQFSSDQELRIVIEEILSVYIKKNKASQVQLLEKVLKLISTLSLHYLEKVDQSDLRNTLSSEQNERLTEILDYIQSNYRDPLSLDEVASLHYISVPYLSKFFKKQTGKTFSQYLNEIRLSHAVNDLVNSHKSITRIALDNGFPNLTAFNRVFNEFYELKPVEYRKQIAGLTEGEGESPKNIDNQEKNDAYTELRQYLKDTEAIKKSIIHDTSEMVESHVIKMEKGKAFSKYWNKVINIGYATDILNSDMQDQITRMQNEIGFTYARFWGLFGDGMQFEDRSGEIIEYNFSNINKLLDFLVKNKLKPFIELGPKPKIISKKVNEWLVFQEISEKSLEEWLNLTRAFLLQCIERYGIEEVETWYFEIWRKSNLFKKNNQQDPIDDFKEYSKVLSRFIGLTKKILPSAKIGGCGLSLDLEGDKLDLLLQQWKLNEIQPDFLSVYMYPLEMDRDTKRIPIKNSQSANPNYVRNKLNQVRKSLKKAGFDNLELNVTEWNISISSRDYLNDSCFKASYLVKNIIENLNHNQVNIIGYWMCSDIFSDFGDSKKLLHGGAGLVTKNGIKKPSYHSFILLKKLGEVLVEKGDNYIVTKKSGDRYQVLCFNYKHFNYSYYLHPEGSTGINEQYNIFENSEPLNFSLDLQGITNGKYRIKELKLNRNHGSVLDEWLKFGAVDDIKPDEVEYLKQICVPYMKVEHSLVDSNSIVLKGELQPHEVRLFELNLLFGEN